MESTSISPVSQSLPSPESTKPFAVGLDVGDKRIDVCVLSPLGEVLEETQIPCKPAAVERLLARLEHARVSLEAGTHSPWISKLVMAAGHQLYLANPHQVSKLAKAHSKNDRNDAHLLAETVLCQPSLLHAIKPRGDDAREQLAVVRSRSALVQTRTLLVNHVRGSVKVTGARLPKCDAGVFHKLEDHLPEERRAILEPVLKLIREITALIKGYDREILDRCQKRPETQLFLTVGSVGANTALAFAAVIEDPLRFANVRKLSSYLGLRPKLRESGSSSPQLKITKAGDPFLRRLLVQCANNLLSTKGKDCDLRRWALQRVGQGDKNRRKRIKVAVARKLGVLLWALWRTNKPYEPLRNSTPEVTSPAT